MVIILPEVAAAPAAEGITREMRSRSFSKSTSGCIHPPNCQTLSSEKNDDKMKRETARRKKNLIAGQDWVVGDQSQRDGVEVGPGRGTLISRPRLLRLGLNGN